MTILDWVVVAVYLVYVVWDGVRMSKHTGKAEGYFLANRSLPWWAVGLSVMATQLSAITLVGTTGQGYADGMRFIQFYYGLPLAMIILCVTAVPFFHRAKVFTAYEYLERRFDSKTRALTSFCFLISRGLGCGVIIAAPSVILSILFGWSEWATIFTMGLTTTVYTMVGGVQAVTWTDVKQMVVIFVGLGVVFFLIFKGIPADVSISNSLHLAGAAGRLTTFDTRFSLKETYTLWSGLVGGLFLMLAYFGCDQSQVQRYLTAKSVDEGRVSLLMSAFVKIPMQFFILMIGVMVFIFYTFQTPPMLFKPVPGVAEGPRAPELQALNQEHDAAHRQRREAALAYARALNGGEESATRSARERYVEANKNLASVRTKAIDVMKSASNDKTYNDVNYIFPSFVVRHMPPGVIGLIIAAIFAAAMSSISAELNSLATAGTIDFYRKYFNPDADDRRYVFVGRVFTAFWGVFACVVALYSTSLGSLIEVVNKFGSFFYGSLLGVFVLAVGFNRATSRGAFWGLICGVATVWLLSLTTSIAFLWFNPIGCLTVVVVGYALSLTQPAPKLVKN